MIVMELLDRSQGWRSLASLNAEELASAKASVYSAVTKMHELKVTNPATGKLKKIAHGDLRPVNILVRQLNIGQTGGWEVKFIDFDWACFNGKSVYPGFLSGDLPWPSKSGQPILQKHDRKFLSETIAEQKARYVSPAGVPEDHQRPPRRSRASSKRNTEASALQQRHQRAEVAYTAAPLIQHSFSPRVNLVCGRPITGFNRPRFI